MVTAYLDASGVPWGAAERAGRRVIHVQGVEIGAPAAGRRSLRCLGAGPRLGGHGVSPSRPSARRRRGGGSSGRGRRPLSGPLRSRGQRSRSAPPPVRSPRSTCPDACDKCSLRARGSAVRDGRVRETRRCCVRRKLPSTCCVSRAATSRSLCRRSALLADDLDEVVDEELFLEQGRAAADDQANFEAERSTSWTSTWRIVCSCCGANTAGRATVSRPPNSAVTRPSALRTGPGPRRRPGTLRGRSRALDRQIKDLLSGDDETYRRWREHALRPPLSPARDGATADRGVRHLRCPPGDQGSSAGPPNDERPPEDPRFGGERRGPQTAAHSRLAPRSALPELREGPGGAPDPGPGSRPFVGFLDLAASWDVDAVLCAGDLFEEQAPEEVWWQGLLREFQRREWRRPVVLLPGNHDPIGRGAVYHADHAFRQSLPDYVHVVDRSGWELPLGDGAALYASPCESKAGQTDLVASLPRREPGDERFRIGMVHGQTFDMEEHQTNFPIARGSAAERGFDYLALRGHARVPGGRTRCGGADRVSRLSGGHYLNEREAGHAVIVFFPRDRRRRAPSAQGTRRMLDVAGGDVPDDGRPSPPEGGAEPAEDGSEARAGDGTTDDGVRRGGTHRHRAWRFDGLDAPSRRARCRAKRAPTGLRRADRLRKRDANARGGRRTSCGPTP